MPVSSEDSLSENVYIEMPESIEVLTRSVPYNDGIERNYPGNFPDMHLEPKQRYDDIAKPTWRDAFDGKWPYTTPLFYKSEEETLSKLQEQTRNLENIQRSSTSLESSQWEGSIRDIWSGSQRNVNEAFELASSDQTSVNKAKGCEKTCRRFLCAFLGLSFLGAILAGVGLTLILTSYNPDNQLLYRQGDLIDPGLSIQEKQYLTQTFCNLVKLMLKGTEFPTESGIASCRTALRLSKETESLQIELLISPEKGFTIKEKFRRALKEEILAEGAYRLNGSNTCLYAGNVRNHITCKGDHNNDGDAGLLLDSAATSDEIRAAVSNNVQEQKTIDRDKTNQVIKKNGSDKEKSKHSTKVKDSEPNLSLNTGADATHAIHKSTSEKSDVREPKENKNMNYVTAESIQNLMHPSTSVYNSTEFKASSSTLLEPSYGETYSTTRPSSKLISEINSAVGTEYDPDVMNPSQSSVTPDYSSSMITDMYDQSPILNDSRPGYVFSAVAMDLDNFSGTTDLPSSEWNRSQSTNASSTETPQYNITSKIEDNIPPKTFDLNFKADEVVTRMREFETQTKNNTVATLKSVHETSAADLGNTLEMKTTESVFDTDAINSQLNAKQSFGATILPTVTASVNDMSNKISALSDSELLFRLNLYGTSKSKNYLRFPIVTGSNGKFLFSPLSNKDTIDIAAKPNVSEGTVDNQTNQKETKTVTKIITVNATNEIGKIETTKQNTTFTNKVKPKPMIVDWKTPPAAKPTNFPKGWESRDIMFNAGVKQGDPAGSKVSFSVPRLNQANF